MTTTAPTATNTPDLTTLGAIAHDLDTHLRPNYNAYVAQYIGDNTHYHISAGSTNPNQLLRIYLHLEGTHLSFSYPLPRITPSEPSLTCSRDYDIAEPGSLDHLHLHVLQALDTMHNQ